MHVDDLPRFLRRSALCPLPFALFLLTMTPAAPAQEPNYDESKVPAYTLPDPLVCADGSKVADADTWRSKRRPEILAILAEQMFGKTPEGKPAMRAEVVEDTPDALGGKARRIQMVLRFGEAPDGPAVDLLVFVPKDATGPVPAFLGLNFQGNHAVHNDPGIRLSTAWFRNDPEHGYVDHRATENSRGSESSRWPIERIIDRGYAVATACYNDIDPDFDDGFKNGVHPLLDPPGTADPDRPADAWGAIGAWAWGLSRCLDALATVPAIDAKRVAVMGHSRLGKTALWAGAQDERFALVLSNDSGEGGAAITRRRFGERIVHLNTSFPHWFCDNFARYNEREDDFPADAHMLIALSAPRPVLVCSATEDLWADPKGEFLACKGADPVYRLLGTDGLAAAEFPAPSKPVLSTIGYHLRPGKHDVTDADWAVYLDFADRHLRPAADGR
jgi:hypothetical protein